MKFIRTDVLKDRKCVHIQIDKGVHAQLRAKCFMYEISMQEMFDEFARLIATEDTRAMKIIDQLAVRKVKETLKQEPKKSYRKRANPVGELEHDTIYSLINEEHDGISRQ